MGFQVYVYKFYCLDLILIIRLFKLGTCAYVSDRMGEDKGEWTGEERGEEAYQILSETENRLYRYTLFINRVK